MEMYLDYSRVIPGLVAQTVETPKSETSFVSLKKIKVVEM
jgi:hypothetical protein